jgi:phosphomannomutase
LAEQVQADLVLMHDPDADRLAVMAHAPDGCLHALTGDEV